MNSSDVRGEFAAEDLINWAHLIIKWNVNFGRKGAYVARLSAYVCLGWDLLVLVVTNTRVQLMHRASSRAR